MLSVCLIHLNPLWNPFFCLRCESLLSPPMLSVSLCRLLKSRMFPRDSWDGTGRPLSVNLTSSLVGGGPVRASLCVFSSVCRYYSAAEGRWRSDGLRPLEGSTLREAHCLTTHLTVFGASLFVHPGAVVLLPPVRHRAVMKNTDV